MAKRRKAKAIFPIGTKLILIMGFFVLISLSTITALVSFFITENDRLKAESNNFTINTRSAGTAENFFNQKKSEVFLLMDMISTIGFNGALSKQSSAYFFERNKEIGAIIMINNPNIDSKSYEEDESNKKQIKKELNLLNSRFIQKYELSEKKIDTFIESEYEAIERAFIGEESVLNTTVYFDTSSLGFVLSWNEGNVNNALLVIASTDEISETFSINSSSMSYIINKDGDLLVYPDYEKLRIGENISNSPIFKQMKKTDDSGRQIFYTDTDGIDYFGAYQKLSFANICVITTVKAEIIYESIKSTTRRNIYLTCAVLFLTIISIAIYSRHLSIRIKRLTKASAEIEIGNFDIKIKNSSNDELTVLTKRFMKMGHGLKEREHLKDTFGKFINKEIAEKAMKGELTLGGESKNVTIFFSDIRSFTAISEKLQPSEVVDFLNDYMTRMVDCVNSTGGVVDKFIGDALMGIWGAPISSGSVARDAFNCVRSALMMRAALIEFNKGRGSRDKPIIKIGCGINTGAVIAGQIGSNQKMEYTVIGDAVNLASRTEALNKPFGTDILITENTYNLIKDYITVEEMPSVTVKGKEKPIKMFAVINIPKATDTFGAGIDGPKTLEEVRKLLGIKTPDLSKVNPDEHEEKYKIEKSKEK